MKVTLMDYTGKGMNDPWYAASLMIWTKRTRTELSPGGMDEIMSWPEEKKVEELKYMSATVPSSWEFCDYTFLIEGVTRAFTHQLVRTRTMSFAQQAMQVLDMSQGPGWKYHTGPTLEADKSERISYDGTMEIIADTYRDMVNAGIKIEDAREILPTGILTNIICKANLRTLADMLRKRASPRNVSEFDQVIIDIKAAMQAVHPWTDIFINRDADKVARDAYSLIGKIEDKKLRTDINKCIDQLLTNIGAGSVGKEEAA